MELVREEVSRVTSFYAQGSLGRQQRREEAEGVQGRTAVVDGVD